MSSTVGMTHIIWAEPTALVIFRFSYHGLKPVATISAEATPLVLFIFYCWLGFAIPCAPGSEGNLVRNYNRTNTGNRAGGEIRFLFHIWLLWNKGVSVLIKCC